MTKDEIIIKIRNGEIKRAVLRQGETYVGEGVYLYLYNENKKDMHMGRLFKSLEESINYYNENLEKGTYYIYSKDQWKPKEQKWFIKLDIY